MIRLPHGDDDSIVAAIRMARTRREDIELKSRGRTVLRISQFGDLEEVRPAPLTAPMGAHVAERVISAIGREQRNAITVARRYLQMVAEMEPAA